MIQFSKPRRSLGKSMEQFRRHETNARDYMQPAPNAMANDRTCHPFFYLLHLSANLLSLFIALSRRSGTPSRFDASFYRTHDALGYIPSDVQSLRSQATYSSGLPMFNAPGPFGAGAGNVPRGTAGAKRSTYSYASSIVSQDVGLGGGTDASSVIGLGNSNGNGIGSAGGVGSIAGAHSGVGGVGGTPHIAYSQSDRLRRRTSFGSASVAGQSDLGSLSQYDYKSQDDAGDMDDMKSQYAGTQSGVTVF
ncbi:hypothetical protein BDN70DRAFT_43016 [Pholiota conissans]|uniref:Uncharacterized protein n=1 Tax=Pholiota conissans TaxID=109636 RepID=A0A9P5YZQ9_9AGAR|nr:hypothetical protein BDN70DRAFT_43016 [Pholiota conissans]